MSVRIYIENPPPFKRVQRTYEGREPEIVGGSMTEGEDVVRHYLASGLRPTGFHHSDLDPFESSEIRDDVPVERFDTFEYARFLKERIGTELCGRLVPHHIGVYRPASEQVTEVEALSADGVKDVVVVGKPHHVPMGGAEYKADVEEVLAALAADRDRHGCDLGAIGIHLRPDEPERIANKFQAAGGRHLRLMGQFLDEADSMVEFLERLAETFEARGLDPARIEYNVGLAIFSLKNREFYAKLLRKDRLACEDRFAKLRSRRRRLDESVRMNTEFADRVLEAGRKTGIDVGFSIQPLLEHRPDGSVHPAVDAAIELARRLERRDETRDASAVSPVACNG